MKFKFIFNRLNLKFKKINHSEAQNLKISLKFSQMNSKLVNNKEILNENIWKIHTVTLYGKEVNTSISIIHVPYCFLPLPCIEQNSWFYGNKLN